MDYDSAAMQQARHALATVVSDGLRAAAEPLLYAGCLDALSTGVSSAQCVSIPDITRCSACGSGVPCAGDIMSEHTGTSLTCL